MNKLLSWLFIIIFTSLLYLWQPEFFYQVYAIIKHGDIAALADYLRSFGHWTIAAIIGLFVIMTFTIVFPFMILSGATGIIYGLFWGTLISWLGEVTGAVIMYVFARYFFRCAVEKWIVKSSYLKQVDDYSADNGFKVLLIARLLPLAPSGIITAVAAISRMSFKDFFMATLLGKLPPVVIKVILGHDIVFASENMARLIIVVVLVILIYAGLWWHKRTKRNSEID
ncbi:TVP38/TMEM64 family inner membrane protein YdjZ [bioreactor metagenome]|uniref:TVP38/TMEM64 family inner membrane protein YdjZ n=1 Tax=bioreactor metagenome TaxID=1076179 RepID=A0A644ZCM4_9ZZZZ